MEAGPVALHPRVSFFGRKSPERFGDLDVSLRRIFTTRREGEPAMISRSENLAPLVSLPGNQLAVSHSLAKGSVALNGALAPGGASLEAAPRRLFLHRSHPHYSQQSNGKRANGR